MRHTGRNTTQTTCDHENADYQRCPALVLTGHMRQGTPAEHAARHQRSLTADGWTDVEGRDYCPECSPAVAAQL
ncbi:hypothetical protein ACWCPT_05885 [Streptomyces sp. NPDC002308]